MCAVVFVGGARAGGRTRSSAATEPPLSSGVWPPCAVAPGSSKAKNLSSSVVNLWFCKLYIIYSCNVPLEWEGAQSRSSRRDGASTGADRLRYQMKLTTVVWPTGRSDECCLVGDSYKAVAIDTARISYADDDRNCFTRGVKFDDSQRGSLNINTMSPDLSQDVVRHRQSRLMTMVHMHTTSA